MKLTLESLKNREAWERAGISLPAYDVAALAERTKKAPVWVHMGIGNIFRIFMGGIADRLVSGGFMDKGITCVETFDFDPGGQNLPSLRQPDLKRDSEK